MPKIRQQNMQVFIITKDNNIDELERFIAKNHGMLKIYLLLIEELTPRLKECLDKYELDYLQPKNFNFHAQNPYISNSEPLIHPKDSSVKVSPSQMKPDSPKAQESSQKSLESQQDSTKMQIFTDLIRSGVEISSDDSIVIFNRVNSGAKINTKQNIFIFGKCDGDVKCDGEYMILSQIANGKVLFNGMAITQNMLKYKLNLIAKEGEIGLKINDIFKV